MFPSLASFLVKGHQENGKNNTAWLKRKYSKEEENSDPLSLNTNATDIQQIWNNIRCVCLNF